ncbi:CLUMA_CG003701, isoform A [Clunio marinus]|uniref:Large ribosomal subunit protein bL32m n=1 Tax=Clunio marinus TaxID=568069 RepID=A0A1J1HPK3_9DIPT|nr:CLUMA_CG003701, isoform A [Clunio marinus]
MNRFLCEISAVLRNFESILFGRYPFPPGSLGLIVHSPSETTTTPQPFSIKDFIGDGFLWAVPKHRRSIEVRMKRKYGSPQYKMKTLYENKKLQICDTCGNYYESGILCGFCYDKVRKETTLIKEKIMKKLHLKPIDSDVVVLYEGEKGEHADEFWEGKRIVEMEKPRPQWFSKNLLQKTTQPNATTKEVKPEELG